MSDQIHPEEFGRAQELDLLQKGSDTARYFAYLLHKSNSTLEETSSTTNLEMPVSVDAATLPEDILTVAYELAEDKYKQLDEFISGERPKFFAYFEFENDSHKAMYEMFMYMVNDRTEGFAVIADDSEKLLIANDAETAIKIQEHLHPDGQAFGMFYQGVRLSELDHDNPVKQSYPMLFS